MKIAYIYYDFLNLYGASGNIKAIQNALSSLKIKSTVACISLDDEIDFNKYDLYYVASGTEDNQLIAIEHLKKYKEEIKQAIENNKFFIVTGNAIDMFGEAIIKKAKRIEALGIFDYKTYYQDKRVIKEVYRTSDLINKKIIGFENHEGLIDKEKYQDEIIYKNFYGTYTLGPILIRNPYLLKYFIKKMLPKVDISKLNLKIEETAYKTFIENYFITEHK